MPKEINPALIRAMFDHKELAVEDLPQVAADALEAGFDGPSLRKIAGLMRPTLRDIEGSLKEMWSEMRAPGLTTKESALLVATDLSQRLLSHPELSEPFIAKFYKLWRACDYCPELAHLAHIDLERHVFGSETEARERILAICESFLAHKEPPDWVWIPTPLSGS